MRKSGWAAGRSERPRETRRCGLAIAPQFHRRHGVEILKRRAILDLQDRECRSIDCMRPKLDAAEARGHTGCARYERRRDDRIIDVNDDGARPRRDELLNLRPGCDNETTSRTTRLVDDRWRPREDSVVAH